MEESNPQKLQESVADSMEEENDQEQEKFEISSSTRTSSLLMIRLMSKRRTWVCLFVVVYAILMASSWNILKSMLYWYDANSSANWPSSPFSSSGWPALYASVVLGAVFGLLSMAAALALAIPATMMTWITVLVLLFFTGKPRRALLAEGQKLTAEIIGSLFKVLIKEGNVVAAVCAVVGYFALFWRRREEEVGAS